MHWLGKTSIAVESVSFLILAEAVFSIEQQSAPRGIYLVYGYKFPHMRYIPRKNGISLILLKTGIFIRK